MFALDDTIVAVATAAGRGGIGVVRVSGPAAADVASALLSRHEPLTPRYATYAHLRSSEHQVSDEVIATFFPAPGSYTGEDVVEISAHGSPVVLDSIVHAAMRAGARLARPGEFTLRGFLTGKRDLVQAEAVGDLIAAATPLQARVAFDQLDGTLTRAITEIDAALFDLVARLEASLDFPDEGYHFIEPADVARQIERLAGEVDSLSASGERGRMIREGATVVIAGRTNVGKSSLFNALLGTDRAIVTDVAGTTRDLVTERVDVEGVEVTLVDTAGARETDDPVEREGVSRGAHARSVADLTLVVLDGSTPLTRDDERVLAETTRARRFVVLNKRDRPTVVSVESIVERGAKSAAIHEVSAETGGGIAGLRTAVRAALVGAEGPPRDTVVVTNARHLELLQRALTHLRTAARAAGAGKAPEEFVLIDLQLARQCFDEVVGVRTSEDVLREIFGRFCIGK